MDELPIYNCHIHTFTRKHVPRDFLKNRWGGLGQLAGPILRWEPAANALLFLAQHLSFVKDGLFQRYARFYSTGNHDHQQVVFDEVRDQYPPETHFVVLPMDMAYMGLGPVEVSIDQQHAELLDLAQRNPGIIPFFAADPRRSGVLAAVDQNIRPDRFRGVKIYPNLGYMPDHPSLMQIYALCQERNVPVMTHSSPGGVWAYRFTDTDRRRVGHPRNYKKILTTFPELRICLAHFGGAEEWEKHLTNPSQGEDAAWVRYITDMIRSGDYPNLYTDISYTMFTVRQTQSTFDYTEYLKVLLADSRIRERVLFGSDFYMIDLETLSEKQLAVSLRSRIGEAWFFQIAHHNPKRYLGLA